MNISKFISFTPLVLGGFLMGANAQEISSQTRLLVKTDEKITISSPMTGKIKYLKVKNGELFKKGQTLVKFDCRIQNAQLNYAKASTNGTYKTLVAKRKLKKLGSGSQLDIDLASAEYTKAKADKNKASAFISLCSIKAPFNGSVVEKHKNNNEYVKEADKVLSILNRDNIIVEVLISAESLTKFKKGTQFNFKVNAINKTYTATIERTGASIDPVSQMLPVYAKVTNADDELIPGMIGTITK